MSRCPAGAVGDTLAALKSGIVCLWPHIFPHRHRHPITADAYRRDAWELPSTQQPVAKANDLQ